VAMRSRKAMHRRNEKAETVPHERDARAYIQILPTWNQQG